MKTFIQSLSGRPNTIKSYTSIFKHIENRVTKYTSESDLDELIQDWFAEGYSPQSIKSMILLANKYIKWLGGTGFDTKPIVSKVMRNKQENLLKVLTRDEIYHILTYIEKHDKNLFLACSIAIRAGLRRGEVFGLKWEDIDLLNNKILVQRSYNGPTKNGKSRYVKISSKLEKVLLSYYTPGSKGKLLNVFDPNPKLKEACKIIGIDKVNFHCLRHTFATHALEAKVSPKDVQVMLGHRNVTTTLNLYWQSQNREINVEFI